MSQKPAKNLTASIKQKLLNHARQSGLDFNALLIRFAMERLLFRLSISTQREHFYLKGAMLFVLWENSAHRPTKDLDLLFIPQYDNEQLVKTFQNTAAIPDLNDGIKIDPESVQAEQIREENTYGGLRIKLVCELGELVVIVDRIKAFTLPVVLDSTIADKAWNPKMGWCPQARVLSHPVRYSS